MFSLHSRLEEGMTDERRIHVRITTQHVVPCILEGVIELYWLCNWVLCIGFVGVCVGGGLYLIVLYVVCVRVCVFGFVRVLSWWRFVPQYMYLFIIIICVSCVSCVVRVCIGGGSYLTIVS